MEKIIFHVPDSDETAEFYVIEQTRMNGVNYILVTEDQSSESDPEANYEMVESEEELEYMMKIFTSMLEDVDITM